MKTNDRRLALLGAALLLAASVRPASAQQTQISGLIFAQYSYQMAADTAGVHENGFDVTRAYLNFITKFSHGISTRITGDVYRDANGSLNYRLKYAFLTWKPSATSPVDFRLGQTTTPWIDWEEGLWGYRMQGPTVFDVNHYLTSGDLGLGMDGAWAKNKFDMQLWFGNGEGYASPETNQYKQYAARLSWRLVPSDDGGTRGGLRLTGYAQSDEATNGGARTVYAYGLSYKSKEYLLAAIGGHAIEGTANTPANIFSFYGTLNPKGSKWGVIARVDLVNPNTRVSNDSNTRFIGGVSYALSPNVLLLLDVDNVSYQGTMTPAQQAQHSALSLHTQFTF